MKRGAWIWITRWQDFQHYQPERDRAPAWIKEYTKQLDDDRYLRLSMYQRAVLHDVRTAFARAHGRLPTDTRQLTQRIGHRVTSVNLDALNHAGFIDYVSRPVLEQRLDQLYSNARARVELEGDKEIPRAADAAAGARKRGKVKTTSYERAAAFTRNAGYQLEPVDFLAELDAFDLTAEQRHEVIELRESTLNGVPK